MEMVRLTIGKVCMTSLHSVLGMINVYGWDSVSVVTCMIFVIFGYNFSFLLLSSPCVILQSHAYIHNAYQWLHTRLSTVQ